MTTKQSAAEKAAEHEAAANEALAEAAAAQAEPEAPAPVAETDDAELAARLEDLAGGLTRGDRASAEAMREAAARLRR
jgi:hypothetical protein